MDKTNVSVVILTKNEETRIRDCIDSVKGWVDEIIVVDDESRDKTVEICRQLADKVIIRKMDNEGAHRNWAYAQARNSWVFSLDADERVTEDLKNAMSRTLRDTADYSGFTVQRKNYIGSIWIKHGGWYPSPQLRLFKKDKFKYEEAGVHPRVFMDGTCGHIKADLLHYSYRNIDDFVIKLNKQTSLEARKWLDQNKPMRLGHFIWRTIDRFFRSFIGKKGFKGGFWGFVVAFFAGLYQFLSYLKFRELVRSKKVVEELNHKK